MLGSFPAFTELETTRNLFSGEESVFGEVFADKRAIDPAVAFWKAERRTKLDQAIDRLPELEKTVIGWHFFEQRSQTEIANLLGVSDATVSRAKRDALKKLKQFLPEVHDCLGLSA